MPEILNSLSGMVNQIGFMADLACGFVLILLKIYGVSKFRMIKLYFPMRSFNCAELLAQNVPNYTW